MAMPTTKPPFVRRGTRHLAMANTIPYPRKGRSHHHPFPSPEEEGVVSGHGHHHQPPVSEGEPGIWSWSQPVSIPEEEGVTGTPSLPQKRKVWFMAMTTTTNPLCQKRRR